MIFSRLLKIFGPQQNKLIAVMQSEWIECNKTFSTGQKCRQCKKSKTFCRNRLITACGCRQPIHERCLMDEIITIEKQCPERLKCQAEGESFWVYSCTFCKGHILFYFDFSAKLIPCHNQSKKKIICLIALMILTIILGFFVPCFLFELLEDKICWFCVGVVGLILICLGYCLYDSVTTIFFRKLVFNNPGTSKQLMTRIQNTQP